VGDLKFLVKNKDTAFFNYTGDFNTDISGSYFLFDNISSSPTRQKGALHRGSIVGKEDIRRVDAGHADFFVKPFGLIHIQLHQDLEESFKISFSSVSTYWCYLLTRNYLQELASPAIIHKETKQAFIGPEPVLLPDGKTALAFFSPMPIPHQERPVVSFQLVEEYDAETLKYKVVLPVLPGPDPHHISSLTTLAAPNGEHFSCIFI
jgi:hypothetical protein